MKDKLEILSIVKRALREDIGRGDITTKAVLWPDLKIKAIILAKEEGILAGVDIAKLAFKSIDKRIKFIPILKDGEKIKKGSVIARIEGKASKILNIERTALNFLMHLSGVSTLTRRFVERIKPYKVKIVDTRKTLPALRILEKYAVKVGGGYNHRMGLFDQVLIKKNHINSLKRVKKLKLKDLIEEVKKKVPEKKIEIEVKNLREFEDALKAKPDIIMLDNMGIKDIKKTVSICKLQTTDYKPKLEASGGVNLENVRKIAKTGVDMISIGALTHSAKAIDMSLEVLID